MARNEDKIYYIFPDYVGEIDVINSTENEFIELIKQEKGIVYNSITEFVNAFNDEFICDLGIIKNFRQN